ncbi:MAG: tetratricopeptide repeat protein [Hyphomicrobiaceae bacterium]|jgi:tetratricopeptide (TPR) repeat protein
MDQRHQTSIKGRALLLAAFFVLLTPSAGAQLAPPDVGQDPEARKERAPGSSTPDSPRKRARKLQDLYAQLAGALDNEAASKAALAIERIWLTSGSDTVSVLMERAVNAANEKRLELAVTLLNTVVELAPDYAEGWNRRAYVHYLRKDVGLAMGDLRRVLALDPSHFKALDGLAQILKEMGDKKSAYAVYKKLIEVHPFWQPAEQAIQELGREVEGQGI